MSGGVTVTNLPKFILAMVLVLCMTVLMLTDKVSSAVGVPFLATVGGYVLGNGIAAFTNKQPTAILGPREAPDPSTGGA